MKWTHLIVMAMCFAQPATLNAAAGGPAPHDEKDGPGNVATPKPSVQPEKPSEKIILTENPTTVQIPLDEMLRTQIAEAVSNPEQPQTVRLVIKGVWLSAEAKKEGGIKLFLNKPDATSATSEKDPHFVGAVDFQPTKDGKPQSFLLDLAPTVAELRRTKQLDLNQPLKVTFAAILSSEKGPQRVQIPIESVEVIVPKQRK
jgi:hypothetical protein